LIYQRQELLRLAALLCPTFAGSLWQLSSILFSSSLLLCRLLQIRVRYFSEILCNLFPPPAKQFTSRMEYNSDRRFGLDDSAQNINILSFKIYSEMMWNRRWATPFLVIQTVRFSRYFDSIRFLSFFFFFSILCL
jgi:hypothetical protein